MMNVHGNNGMAWSAHYASPHACEGTLAPGLRGTVIMHITVLSRSSPMVQAASSRLEHDHDHDHATRVAESWPRLPCRWVLALSRTSTVAN